MDLAKRIRDHGKGGPARDDPQARGGVEAIRAMITDLLPQRRTRARRSAAVPLSEAVSLHRPDVEPLAVSRGQEWVSSPDAIIGVALVRRAAAV